MLAVNIESTETFDTEMIETMQVQAEETEIRTKAEIVQKFKVRGNYS